MKPLNPVRHPIDGRILEITHSSQTDIRKTFERVRAEQNKEMIPSVAEYFTIKRHLGMAITG